jgi:RNA recognition motif-containing protein
MSRLYVGNLDWATDEDKLRALFGQDGRTVTEVMLKRDRRTGRSRGFAFVDLASDEEVEAAIAALNGAELDGREIKVGAAKALPVRHATEPDFSRGGRFGGGRGGGRGRR